MRSPERIIEWRTCPEKIRCDNGPEYVSDHLLSWAEKRGIFIQHIQPGKAQQNAFIEQYKRTVRHEWLGQYLFNSLAQLQDFSTKWLWIYNNERSHMGIGGVTSAMKRKQAP